MDYSKKQNDLFAIRGRRVSHCKFLYLTFLVFTVGCTTLHGGRIVEVQNHKVDYVLSGEKQPIVVFENGLGGEYFWWAKIFPEVAKSQIAFAYNRPGYGKSDSRVTPRDAENIVSELRITLQKLGLKPPYILVGHSVGGLYFQYYARRFPQEVKGLILVDSTHPQQMQGDGAIEKWPWWVKTLVNVLTLKPGLSELPEVEKSGEQVLALAPLDTQKIRTVIMLATEPENPTSKLEKHAVDMRQDFHRLYPGAEFVTVKGGHGIPLESPEIVIEQIRKLSK